MKCNCDYCYFQSVGVAKEAVEFVDQTEAKIKAFGFVHDAFRQAHPQRRADGLSENTVAIMLGEWGLGKTQFLKYLRTVINNSSGVSAQLQGEYDIPFGPDSQLAKVTFASFFKDILKEDPGFEPQGQEQLKLFTERRGVAFRIDALSFHDQIAGSANLLIPLFNIVLRRCQIDYSVTSDDDLRNVSALILEHLKVDRIFIFFDELEALRTAETGTLQFDRFFQNFALRVKSLVDNSSPPDVSICLATIPSVWEALTRQFEELGALKSRANTAFIRLLPLTLDKAHQFILSRCGTVDNSPFSDGTIRTLLEATGKNPRYLNQLCYGLQPTLEKSSERQYSHVLTYLSTTATDQTAFTYDHQALLELKDAATEGLPGSQMATDLLNILAGELQEYSPAQLRQPLGGKSVTKIEEELNKLSTMRLRGVFPVVRLIPLTLSKARMQGKSLPEQQRQLVAQRYLSESDVRIEKQRLLVYDLDYERQIIASLETRYFNGSSAECFLPVDDDGGLEEMMSLWQLNEAASLEICRTLRSLAAVPQSVPKYRLSMAARERVFPRQSPKEPPFEWVDETFWRETFADLHNPTKPSSEKRKLLLNGLRLAGQAYDAECTSVDETAFLWVLANPNLKNPRYADPKPLRALVQLVTNITDLDTPELKQRLHSKQPDFLICISLTHLTDRRKVISTPQGRSQIEVIYHELGTREEFKLQLLSRLIQEATAYSWYKSEKMEVAQKTIADEVYGKVVENWLEQARETGYLVNSWRMPRNVREDSLARVIREVISTTPDQPVILDGIKKLLRRLGLREKLDEDLVAVLVENEQLNHGQHDRLKIQLLPTQKCIVELLDRFPRNHGERVEDYVERIKHCFWQGLNTGLTSELTRHTLVIEELGYFDSHADLELILKRIEEKLAKVTAKDKDGAFIDQYAFEARRQDPIGVKRAERLSRELEYFREQYHLHETEFQRLEHDMELLTPRVIRHQLIEVEKRAQEIIATGESPYLRGQKAVRNARDLLEATHYELAGDGAEIKIKDHVAILRDHANHPLLGDIAAAHRNGVAIDDEAKGIASAHSLAQKLTEKLQELIDERDEIQKEIRAYNEQHHQLIAQANLLHQQPGLQRQVAVQINKLKSAEPNQIFRIVKNKLESSGLTAGRKTITDAQVELDKIKKQLDDIAKLAHDLERLGEIIGFLKNQEELAALFLEPTTVTLWGKTYNLAFVVEDAKATVKRIQESRKKLEKLQGEYRGSETERDTLDEAEAAKDQISSGVERLRNNRDAALEEVETDIGDEEARFEHLINQVKAMGDWAAHVAKSAGSTFRSELHQLLTGLFKSSAQSTFQIALQEADTQLIQGFQVIQQITDITSWLQTHHLHEEDFAGTDMEKEARELSKEETRIKKEANQMARLKKWEVLTEKLDLLLNSNTSSDESSGLIPRFNAAVEALYTQATEAINKQIRAVESFVGALFAAKLLTLPQRQELLGQLNTLRNADASYRSLTEGIRQLYQQAQENAKSQLQVKELPDGHDPDTVLAVVQAAYDQPNLSFSQALKLDTKTGGSTILWLIREGVFEGQLRLVKE